MWEADLLRIRWIRGGIQVLRRNLYILADYIRDHWSGMRWIVLGHIHDSMGNIARQLEERYDMIFGILRDYNRVRLWEQLDLFGGN